LGVAKRENPATVDCTMLVVVTTADLHSPELLPQVEGHQPITQLLGNSVTLLVDQANSYASDSTCLTFLTIHILQELQFRDHIAPKGCG
jgi:hypothetical protein